MNWLQMQREDSYYITFLQALEPQSTQQPQTLAAFQPISQYIRLDNGETQNQQQ